MDNDLMARRLRPPSELTQATPMQPFEPMTSTEQVPPWDLVQPPQQVAPVQHAAPAQPAEHLPEWPPKPQTPASPTPSLPPALVAPEWPPAPAPAAQQTAETADPVSALWPPESREEVPWDRPDDFEQPTDTATADDQATWDKPPDEAWVDPNPLWPPVANAVAAQQTLESTDPDDAYAPVVGDVAPTMSLAWPETNGHHSDLNGASIDRNGHAEATVPVESVAVAQPVEDAPQAAWPEAAPVQPEEAASQPEWVLPQPAWAAPEPESVAPEPEPVAPEPESVASEPLATNAPWFTPELQAAAPVPEPFVGEPSISPVPAQPVGYAEHQVGPTPPDDLFMTAAATAVAEPEQEPAVEAEPEQTDVDAWLNESAWPSEPPEPDFPPAPELPLAAPLPPDVEWTEAAAAAAVDDSEPAYDEVEEAPPLVFEAPAAEAPASEAAAPQAASSPVVLRIELAIVDGQLQVVNSANTANVTPREVEAPAVASRNADIDAPSDTTPDEPQAATHVTLAPLPPATDQPAWSDEVNQVEVPTPTPTVPWATSVFASSAPDVAEPAPGPVAASYSPWVQDPPSMDPLAAIPAQQFATPPAQQDYAPQAVEAPSIFAPPLQTYEPEPYALEPVTPDPYVDMAPAGAAAVGPAVAQDQSDLWFLSTEPDDVDAVTTEEDNVAPKEPSSVMTAALTIGMAILVIVLVLVFFSLMTSLLG